AEDGARWIKTLVNVEDHVFVPDIDPDEIGDQGNKFVEDYISRLTMLPLDRSRPLWDIHILNVKTSDAEAAGLIRSHHSLGDGMSRMSLILACTHKSSDPEALPTIPILKRRENVSHGLRNTGWFLSSMFAIYATVRLIWNTIVDFLLLLATVLFLKDTETSLKGGAEAESNAKRFSHRIVSLNDVSLIKDIMDMTINDVLLGVTQAALSRYLNVAHDKTNGNAGTSRPLLNNIPCNVRIRAGILVNLRSEIGVQIRAALFNRLLLSTTAFISNVNGPTEEISLHGHPIAYIAPSVYGHAQALLIHFQSYADKMVISIAVDPTIIPDPHKLCDAMEESLKSMKIALLGKGY
uniref:Uncharacterized protein n=1 Tax=Brassica oleracea var. oleracea TaxID=109376 RepID=A0A0D3EAN0_BRAOL